MQTDKNDMKVEQSVSIHSHALERPCKYQIVTDPKSCNASHIYFPQKEPIKVKIFETFECSGQILSNSLCQFWSDKLIPLQIWYPSSVSWKITPSYFLAQTIYTLLKRSLLKWKFLRLSSAKVKICQNPHVSFEVTSQFLFKFCVIVHCHDR